ncbi:MAG TPA: TIGR03067 domain-containing protein [Pirellulales bacterium]|nr:TIGR03067 domain-containing protein [Pirellulales bacterium]
MKGKILMAAGALLVVGAAMMFGNASWRGLDGTWWAVAGIRDGVAIHMEDGDLRLTFDGYKMTSVETLGEGRFSPPKVFTVMVDKKAKTIDIPDDDRRGLGIYKLEGDTLTLCVNEEGERPTKFESIKGSKNMLLVLKRK